MKRDSYFSLLFVVSGLGLAAAGLSGIRSGNDPLHSRNPLAVQGSAYGKLLARLSETTIDRVWHLGVEQIVPHYMSGEEEHHGENPPVHATSNEVESAPDDSPKPTLVYTPITEADRSALELGKKWIQKRVIAQYTRTNPNTLNERHLSNVYRDIEKMLLRSFKLDPTHYGTYDSYHLFLTTHDFGGSTESTGHAERIAHAVIATVFNESEDPEPWLTAAAAAMNLFQMATLSNATNGTPIPLEILKEYQNKIGYCLSRFDAVQAEAEKLGNWQRLSTERQMEIAERSLFAKRTFKQFDVMIARAEATIQPAIPEGEVAESAPAKED